MTCPSFFIIPSLACQAACKYCFGPHSGAIMDEDTARSSIAFIRSIAEETGTDELSITFHGGEPLLAPLPVWHELLGGIPGLRAEYLVHITLQSNLWNLTDELLALFAEHRVAIGTSLDGPREICDSTRGEGYFDKTWAAACKAKAAGCFTGAIATIAKPTLPLIKEIATFFRNHDLSLMLHGALDALQGQGHDLALTATDYAAMIKNLYAWYLPNRNTIKIDTLDHFARGIVSGKPGVCSFQDCSRMFLAIAPSGEITSCQRLAG